MDVVLSQGKSPQNRFCQYILITKFVPRKNEIRHSTANYVLLQRMFFKDKPKGANSDIEIVADPKRFNTNT